MPERVHKILDSEYKIVPEFKYATGTTSTGPDPYWHGTLMYVRKDCCEK